MTLQEFKIKAKWSPNGGLDSAANYLGPDLSDWLSGPSQSRDSDILAQSNFACALDQLGGEVEGQVEVHRFGHWACGWFETILVNAANDTACAELLKIHDALENYPVLNDSDFSDREYEYNSDYADGAKAELAGALKMHFGIESNIRGIDKALERVAYDLNMECQMYYSADACINVYDCREPDEDDLKRLLTCLNQCDFIHNTICGPDSLEQAIAEYLVACLDGVVK